MDGLEFKPAQLRDAETVLSLCKENMDEYEDTAALDYEKVIDWIRRKINTCISEYTRVFKDGELCGYYRFHPDGDKYELDDLYLFENFRGMGIGSAILEKCLEESDKTVYLYVFKKNGRALGLYKKYGFEVVKDLGTRYIMEKKI